jgi:ketosteroid isomerase-like protein
VADRLIEITEEIYEKFNERDFDSMLAHADPEFEVHDRDRTGLVHRGHEGWRSFIREWMETWDTYTVDVQEIERSGDNVFVHLMQSGVGRESGIEFREAFSQVLSFRDEKVVRFAIFVDRAEAERAAGLRD